MHIHSSVLKQAQAALGIDVLSDSDKEALFNQFGQTIIENTLLQFLASQSEWEQNSFESWMLAHAGDSDMFSQLLLLYPDFGKILTAEILLLKQTNL